MAIKEKHRVEEAQRERRKQNEINGVKWEPIYFEQKLIEATNERIFRYNGKYWEDREKQDWSKLTKIFE